MCRTIIIASSWVFAGRVKLERGLDYIFIPIETKSNISSQYYAEEIIDMIQVCVGTTDKDVLLH